MKKFRLRDLLTKYPALDEMRTSFLARICTVGINLYERGYPIIKIMTPAAQQILQEKRPVIYAVYHGRMIGMLHILDDRSKLTALISRSRDGELLTRIAQNLGYSVARGSPAFRAIEAARQLVAAARSGQSLTIAVDGPRGPIYEVKPGVIRMAEITGLPLLPFFCNFKKEAHWWGSWDKIAGGYFGTPMLYLVGEPIDVPRDLSDDDRENLRQKLEAQMNWLRERANEYW
jgi:hypothetical protein